MAIRKMSFALSCAAALLSATAQSPAQTEEPKLAALAASAPTAVPALVPFSGVAIARDGKPLAGESSLAFLIYKDEQGGEPLFAETQTVVLDATGRYKAQLGASLSGGLPIELFATGEARWLEVQIAGQKPQPRVLLASVPYALKAADAATLGGLPASAFALAGTIAAINAAAGAAGEPTPNSNSTVTTPGGASGYVPQFTGASTIANSPVFVSGSNVGIGTTTPAQTLDVNGTTVFRKNVYVYHNGTAVPSAGVNSVPMVFLTEGYNSSTKSVVAPAYQLKAEVAGNNTAAPSATFNLLYSNGAGTVETGFHFNPNGTINFAPGQTFPGGNITSVGLSAPSSDFSVSGSPLTGAGTLGLSWKVAPTSADNANAIVKRDASGSFTAGAITGNLGMVGTTAVNGTNGVAGVHNGGGIGVYGESLQPGGAGLYGDGAGYGVEGYGGAYGFYGTGGYIGVWAESTNTTSANADGVHGVTASGLASGVAGVNNAGGVGVYGVGGTGLFGTGSTGVFGSGSSYGMVTDSNVQQARAAGGWVKAMVEVDNNSGPQAKKSGSKADGSPSSISRCFNSTLAGAAATTPPCGIALQDGYGTGVYVLTFNFEVDDRFYSTQLVDGTAGVLQIFKDDTETMTMATIDLNGDAYPGSFQMVVY